jgi:hypothetical protein
MHEAIDDGRSHGATRGSQPEGGVAPQPPGVARGNVLRQSAIGLGGIVQGQGGKRTMADAVVLAAIVIVGATAGRIPSNERIEQPDALRGHDAIEPVNRTGSRLDGAAPIRKRDPIERPVRRAREHDEHGDVTPHAVRVMELAVIVQHAARRALVAPITVIVVLARHGGHAPRDPGRALVGADDGVDRRPESLRRAAALEPATVDGDVRRRLGGGRLQFRNRGPPTSIRSTCPWRRGSARAMRKVRR